MQEAVVASADFAIVAKKQRTEDVRWNLCDLGGAEFWHGPLVPEGMPSRMIHRKIKEKKKCTCLCHVFHLVVGCQCALTAIQIYTDPANWCTHKYGRILGCAPPGETFM